MDIPLDLTGLGISVQIVIIDLLLSTDNALVIALACRGLPAEDRGRAMVLGTGAAIVLRVLAAIFVAVALALPYLKLAGGVVLAIIAVRLLADEDDPAVPAGDGDDEATAPGTGDALRILRAVGAIVTADAIMSLDNVIAVAAVARGSLGFLVLGLGLSIRVLDRTPVLVTLSGLYLGWTAGDIAVSDPAISGWVAGTAPGLAVIVPLVGAVFVLWESRVLVQERRKRAGTDARASRHRTGEEQNAE
jgi:YjbE family integral membrane protein